MSKVNTVKVKSTHGDETVILPPNLRVDQIKNDHLRRHGLKGKDLDHYAVLLDGMVVRP